MTIYKLFADQSYKCITS